MQNKVIEIVSNAINEFNEININKIDYDGVDTVLMGNGSKLDSLGLVSLLITIEQHITDEFEKDITIADEKAMSQKHSPFRTVGSLSNYIQEMINDE